MRKLWTEEENQLIKDKVAKGLNYKQIAELLPDRAYRSVAVQGNKLGIIIQANNYWSEEDIQLLIQLRSEGFNNKEIAEELERTHISVRTKASELLKAGLIERLPDFAGKRGNAETKLYLGPEDGISGVEYMRRKNSTGTI